MRARNESNLWKCLVAGLSGLALVVLPACGPGEPGESLAQESDSVPEDKNRPPMPSMKRPAPKTVSPVLANKVRYEQVRNAQDYGFNSVTGFLKATDTKSGETLWVKRVYEVPVDDSMERDVQDVFFRSMAVSSDRGSLLIENERGEHYSVDLETGESTAVSN